MKKTALWCVICLFVLSIVADAVELKTPLPLTAQVVGAAGHRTICYWVFAESAEKAPLDGAWYLTNFPGKVTALSDACLVKNAPDTLDQNNKVVLTLKPVEGAVKYHVFKTELLTAPTIEARAKSREARTSCTTGRKVTTGGETHSRRSVPRHLQSRRF